MDISAYTHTRNPASIGFPAKDNISAFNNSPVMGENLIIDQSQDAYSQATQAFRQLGHDVVETPFREDAVSSDFEKVKAQYRGMMMASKNTADQYQRVADGRGHIAGVSSLIDDIHSGYQKKYGEIVKASTQYMQEINTALGKMSDYLKPGSDGKIKFTPEGFALHLDQVVSKYTGQTKPSNMSLSQYFGTWGDNLDNKYQKPLFAYDIDATPYLNRVREHKDLIDTNTQAFIDKRTEIYNEMFEFAEKSMAFWEKKLSGQGFVVKLNKTTSPISASIHIYPDLKPMAEIFAVIKNSPVDWEGSDMSAQSFQSLQTAIDAQKNAVNSSVSRLLETFRQDNSHFETLVQLLIQLIKDLNQNNNSLINM